MSGGEENRYRIGNWTIKRKVQYSFVSTSLPSIRLSRTALIGRVIVTEQDMLSEAGGPCTQLSRSNLSTSHNQESSLLLSQSSLRVPQPPAATAESLVPSTARSEPPPSTSQEDRGKVVGEKEKDTKPKLSEYACTPHEVSFHTLAQALSEHD